jgi:aminopeptidase-like protein
MESTRGSFSGKVSHTTESAEHRKSPSGSTLPLNVVIDLLRRPTDEASSYLRARGDEMLALIRRLYPICRSITGHGVRETLRVVGEQIPLDISEVPSQTPVFDWTVPNEWNIRDAYIKNRQGERLVDFQKCNLHVVSYSVPVHQKMKPEELQPHLFSLPEHPKWIPYRTSYYRESWGFCVSHEQEQALMAHPEEVYEVCIDASLQPGSLTYAEHFLPGEMKEEVLISCHICHPSLCNDNLSGISVAVALAQTLAQSPRRYSYRFLFVPGTIGSITWLCRNESKVGRIKHGLVLTCVGDSGKVQYKKSRRGDAEVDQAALHVLKHHGSDFGVLEFYPYGYDERQYCSPGFNLPVGALMRSQHGTFPEYHTSADNLDFVKPEALADSYAVALSVIHVLEKNAVYVNQNPKGEPRLGKRDLSSVKLGLTDKNIPMAMLWVLNLSDGAHSLLDIADRSGMDFFRIAVAAEALNQTDLLTILQGEGE